MNKKGQISIGAAIIIITLILYIGGGIFVAIKSANIKNNECLQDIAKDFCESNEERFNTVNWFFDETTFYCYVRERSLEDYEYQFTEAELEECGI